jgi:hypothetical protein
MCDYSLQHLASRPAKVGDRLVSTKFTNSVTRGFTAVGDPQVAVCLLPGTELAFDEDVKYDGLFWIPRRKKDHVARFRRLDEDQQASHHDALEFPSGETVLVTRRARTNMLRCCSCQLTSVLPELNQPPRMCSRRFRGSTPPSDPPDSIEVKLCCPYPCRRQVPPGAAELA